MEKSIHQAKEEISKGPHLMEEGVMGVSERAVDFSPGAFGCGCAS